MLSNSKRILHVGVNYLIAPVQQFTRVQVLQFLQGLATGSGSSTSIQFDASQRIGPQEVFQRKTSPLELRFGPVAESGFQVGQVLITAPNPTSPIETFIDEAETILAAYRETLSAPVQVVRRDCTVRHLYAVKEDHAFRFLWEKRLHQSENSLEVFGRPVAGGGLRFVMPPDPQKGEPMMDIKIESLLNDPTQLFVEAGFAWPVPVASDELTARPLVDMVENYLSNQVERFIMEQE